MLNVRLTSAGRWNISASFLAAHTLRPFKPELDAKGGHRYFRVGLYIYIYIEFYWQLGAIRSDTDGKWKNAISRDRFDGITPLLICYGHRCRAGTRGPDVCGSWWKFFCRDINFVSGGTRVIVSCIYAIGSSRFICC